MENINELEPKRVFHYFYEISKIPRGSGNMEKIADYCMEFAKEHSLLAVRDDANNVIIYKSGAKGYENSETVILQGHLDMVCQKDIDSKICFETDGITLLKDQDYIVADGTTLGADNGIAVAIILAILEDDTLIHPPIEAVFTTDEEIGMLGAIKLDFTLLKGKKMINLDAEETKNVTVSCAGGSDFRMNIPIKREKVSKSLVQLEISGLLGGHSGMEINSNRVNSNILMARVLNSLKKDVDFDIISIDGGDKGNAIPLYTKARLVASDKNKLNRTAQNILNVIKTEISCFEPNFEWNISIIDSGEYEAIKSPDTNEIIYMLNMAPNGVLAMSSNIDNLVETSLNLGILKTDEEEIEMLFTLRSSKKSALLALEEKMQTYSECVPCKTSISGQYPPWEFKDGSVLQKIYKEKHLKKFGFPCEITAIHAGLECGVFASKIDDLDCIAFGPDTYDVHTTKERLSIPSTKHTYELVTEILRELK